MLDLASRPVIDPTDEDENAYLFTEKEKAAIFSSLSNEEIAAALDERPAPKPAKTPEPRRFDAFELAPEPVGSARARSDLKADPKPRRYDPGFPKGIKKLAPGVYEVLSFREKGKSYRVDLRNGTCSCPAHANNPGKECKHQYQAWEEVATETFHTALSQPLAKLEKAVEKTTRPEVRNALIFALLRKQDRFQPEI